MGFRLLFAINNYMFYHENIELTSKIQKSYP
jgi:hypothetical protein